MGTTKVVNGRLELPPEASKWAGPEDELVVFVVGDTLIIKKLHPLCLSELAGRAPGDKEIPLEEIAEEVHAHRREKRHARGA